MEPDRTTWPTRARARRCRGSVTALCSIVVATLVVAAPLPREGAGVARAPARPAAPAEQRGSSALVLAITRAVVLRDLEVGTGGTLRRDTLTGSSIVSLLGGDAAHPLAPAAPGEPADIATAFVGRTAVLFGLDGAHTELRAASTSPVIGGSAVRFEQLVDGAPVLAAALVVRIGLDGSVVSVAGELSRATPDSAAAPATSAEAATAIALGVAAGVDDIGHTVDVDGAELVADAPTLVRYDPSLLGPGDAASELVWSVEVHDALGDVSRRVLVDAADGHVALQFGDLALAKQRRVCDDANNASNSETCANSGPLVARTEGQGPSGVADVDRAYDLAGVTYDFYWSVLQRNSLDGAGMTLVSTVRYCEAPGALSCPGTGAAWNGTQMVYADGWASADDIVGHEFTHGFTERTAGLLMYGESGAIAESISDVIGELIDQQSTVSGADAPSDLWKIGEQLPGGAIRNMASPATFDDPDRMTSSRFAGSTDDSHGVHTNSGVGNKAAYLIAAGTGAEAGGVFNGQAITGIGNSKTARVFAEAATSLLGPGSDYADLFDILPQACTNLIGAGVLTTTDCQQVHKAVIATEMDQAPLSPGARLTAPICDSGKVVTSRLFDDDMEAPSLPKWSRPTPTNVAGRWVSLPGSSVSGTRSLHGPNLDETSVADAALATSVFVPTGTTTYLRFSHSYSMEADLSAAPFGYYDGGVVEYTTNNGASWSDAAILTGTVNGYPGDASISATSDNMLAGDPAYSGTSAGYQQTRINLSSLGGNAVKIRFRVGTDGTTAWDGWFVDDVAIYTCDPPSAPDAPTSVAAVSGHQSAALSWAAPIDDGGATITAYRVTPYIGATARPTVTTPDADTSFQVIGLTNGTQYTFTIAAINSVGVGTASAASNAITPAPGPPWQPTGAVATRSDMSASVDWTTPGSDGGTPITQYVVTPYIGAAAQTPFVTANTTPRAVVPGLANGTVYTFRVSAVNATSTGPPSPPSNAVTPAGLPDPATFVNAIAGQLSASVSWTAPAWNNGAAVANYVITPYVGATPQTPVTTPTAATAYTMTGLLWGVPYTFRIAAVNAVGTGVGSAASSAVAPSAEMPTAPTTVVATRGDHTVALTWTVPSYDGGAPIHHYIVTPYIGLAAQSPIPTSDGSNAFVVSSLTNGTAYTFTVAAVNQGHRYDPPGPASTATGAVVPAGVSNPATGPHAVQHHRSVDLTWSQPLFVNGSAVTAYVITPYRAGVAQPSITTPTAVESYVVAPLTNGQAYSFTIVAVNAVGGSVPSTVSNTVTPVGPPDPPSGITGQRGDGTVSLQWVSPADTGGQPVTNYVISPYVDGVARTPVVTPSSATTFGLSSMTNGTQYTFRVAAVSVIGTGPQSSDFVVLTPAGSPGRPTGVTGLAGNGSALLSWVVPTNDGGEAITGYDVTTFLDGVAIKTDRAPSTGVSVVVSGLDRRRKYTFNVTARNATGPGTPSEPTPPLQPTKVGFTAAGPDRIFDTRAGESPDARRQVAKAKVGGANILEVKVTDLAGLVPASDVAAVSLNVVATNAEGSGFVTVFPCGERKLVASVNYSVGQTVANAVVAPVSAAGTVCFYSLAPTDLIVDLNGWFAAGSNFAAVGPDRVLDTRPGESPSALRAVPKAKVGGADVLQVQMTDLPALIPANNVGAVSLNVAVTNPDAAGFVTVFPCGDRKLVASVNFLKGQTVANAVIAPVSPTGLVCFYSLVPTDLIVDVNGWFAAGSDFTAIGPDRVLDTRPGESPLALRAVDKVRIGGATVLQVRVVGLGSMTPATGVGAVSLNVAVTNPQATGFVTVFPCGERKLVASLNYAANQTVANAVIAPVSATGTVCFYSLAPTDLIVDINGWFPTAD